MEQRPQAWITEFDDASELDSEEEAAPNVLLPCSRLPATIPRFIKMDHMKLLIPVEWKIVKFNIFYVGTFSINKLK